MGRKRCEEEMRKRMRMRDKRSKVRRESGERQEKKRE